MADPITGMGAVSAAPIPDFRYAVTVLLWVIAILAWALALGLFTKSNVAPVTYRETRAEIADMRAQALFKSVAGKAALAEFQATGWVTVRSKASPTHTYIVYPHNIIVAVGDSSFRTGFRAVNAACVGIPVFLPVVFPVMDSLLALWLMCSYDEAGLARVANWQVWDHNIPRMFNVPRPAAFPGVARR